MNKRNKEIYPYYSVSGLDASGLFFSLLNCIHLCSHFCCIDKMQRWLWSRWLRIQCVMAQTHTHNTILCKTKTRQREHWWAWCWDSFKPAVVKTEPRWWPLQKTLLRLRTFRVLFTRSLTQNVRSHFFFNGISKFSARYVILFLIFFFSRCCFSTLCSCG